MNIQHAVLAAAGAAAHHIDLRTAGNTQQGAITAELQGIFDRLDAADGRDLCATFDRYLLLGGHQHFRSLQLRPVAYGHLLCIHLHRSVVGAAAPPQQQTFHA